MITPDPETSRPASNAWHIRTRRHFIPWTDLQPGVLVPPRRHWTSGLGQLVLSVSPPPAGSLFGQVTLHDYDAPADADPVYTKDVATAYGLACPQLPDPVSDEHRVEGAPPFATDWTKKAQIPVANELAEGDVLPQALIHLPNGTQQVAALSLNYDGRVVVVLRDSRITRRYAYRPDEAVLFPRLDDRPVPDRASPTERIESRFRAIQTARVHAWRRDPVTGQVFRFIEHPYGRGKWPAFVPSWRPGLVHEAGDVITVRRPTMEQLPEYHQLLEALDDDEIRTLEPTVSHVQDTTRIQYGVTTD